MVCIVAGQNEQHLSGFDLVSLICISFNMPFFCSKMSALINSSWNKSVSVIPVAKSFEIFPKRNEWSVLVCSWRYADSTLSQLVLFIPRDGDSFPKYFYLNPNSTVSYSLPQAGTGIPQISSYIEMSCWWPKNCSILSVWNCELE